MAFPYAHDRRDADFENVDFTGATFQNVNLSGARFREANLHNASFSGMIVGMRVNDVEIAPLIRTELDRRYPERTRLRPRDAAGVRDGWNVVEQLWATTKARAGGLDEALLHERVDGEWSFLETFRHLVFVTDAWISGTVLGRTGHFHPHGVMPTFLTDPAPFAIDMGADPPFADVVAMREDRMQVVRELIAPLADDDLTRQCGDHTMLFCLCTLFDEEWHHNWYANRDLDVLVTR